MFKKQKIISLFKDICNLKNQSHVYVHDPILNRYAAYPLSDTLIKAHIRGEKRIAGNVVDYEGFFSYVAVDLDQGAVSTLCSQKIFNLIGDPLNFYFSVSKNAGLHFFIFFNKKIKYEKGIIREQDFKEYLQNKIGGKDFFYNILPKRREAAICLPFFGLNFSKKTLAVLTNIMQNGVGEDTLKKYIIN